MLKRADIEPLIIEEWEKRPPQKRTEMDVLLFYGELHKNRPGLLDFRSQADKYQVLKTILRNHIKR